MLSYIAFHSIAWLSVDVSNRLAANSRIKLTTIISFLAMRSLQGTTRLLHSCVMVEYLF